MPGSFLEDTLALAPRYYLRHILSSRSLYSCGGGCALAQASEVGPMNAHFVAIRRLRFIPLGS